MPDGRKWSEYSPEEQKSKIEGNKLLIWATADLLSKTQNWKDPTEPTPNFIIKDPTVPIRKEIYEIMTENPFPYTPEVREQLQDAWNRCIKAGQEHDADMEEVRTKQAEFLKKQHEELKARGLITTR